jgi:hypothetical protein
MSDVAMNIGEKLAKGQYMGGALVDVALKAAGLGKDTLSKGNLSKVMSDTKLKAFVEAYLNTGEVQNPPPEAKEIIDALRAIKKNNPDMFNQVAASVRGAVNENAKASAEKTKANNMLLASAELEGLSNVSDEVIGGDLRKKYEGLLKGFEGKSAEEQMAALQKFGGELSEREIKQLMTSGGDIGQAAAATGMMKGLYKTGVTTEAGLKGQMRKVTQALGYDVEKEMSPEQKKRLEEILSDKRVTTAERFEVGRMMEDVQKRKGIEDKRDPTKVAAAGGELGQISANLAQYVEKNKEFLQVAGDVIPKLKGAADNVSASNPVPTVPSDQQPGKP